MPFTFLRTIWDPPGIDLISPEESRRYMTRVIYLRALLSLLAFTGIIALFVFLGQLPFISLVTVLALDLLTAFGIYLNVLHQYRFSPFVLIGMFLALGMYGSLDGGHVGTTLVFYVNAILLSAHLVGQGAMWSMVAVSLGAHVSITVYLLRPEIPALVSGFIPMLGGVLGVAFLESYVARVRERSVNSFQQSVRALEDEIVERYKAEEALRESERRYRDVVEQATDVIFTINVGGFYTFVNAAALRVSGYSKDEMLRLLYTDLVLPKFVRRVKVHFYRQYIERTAFTYAEYPFRSKRGDIVWLGYNVSLLMEGEQILGFHVIGRDITERKLFEEAIRRSEQHYRNLFECVYDPIIIYDPDTRRVLDVNPRACEVYGYSRTEFGGLNIDRLILSGERPSGGERSIASSDVPRQFEAIHVRSDGAQLSMLVIESRIDYRDRQAMLSMNRDITERKVAEEALRQGQKMESLGIMAGGIAHDFNNLLQAIMGQTALALGRMDKTSNAFGHVQKAEKAALRASELTQQLLAYSGRGKFQLRRMNVNELLRENLHLLEVAIPKTTRLQLTLGPNLWDIEADPGQMQQLAMNLIINAGEAIGEGPGQITVRSSMEHLTLEEQRKWSRTGELLSLGSYVVVEVEDDGSGMSEAVIHKIFDPFFTTKFTGRGLGLAAVLGIIRGHRGGLFVESVEGRGTIFRVALPALEPTSMSERIDEQAVFEPFEGRVLVIDDETLVREVVTDIVQGAGIDLLLAENGETGIAMYRDFQKDIRVVLLDLSMPGMSGEETFRRLKKLNADVKVIVSSGYSETEAMSRLGVEGVAGFIQKPYRGNALLAALSLVAKRS